MAEGATIDGVNTRMPVTGVAAVALTLGDALATATAAVVPVTTVIPADTCC